ncbi:MAG: hypothetical protein AAB787_00860 [Patescibacteria group bacterium]
MPTFKPEENFVREYKFESTKRPSSFYKTIALHVLTVAAAFIFGLLYWKYLNGNAGIFVALASLVIYLVFTSLEVILIKNLRVRSIIIGLEVIAPVLLFLKTPIGILGTAILTLAIMAILGEITARKKMSNSIKPSYIKITRSKTTRMVTAISLLVILLYAPRLDENGNIISEGVFDRIFQQVVGVTNKIYPTLNFEQSVSEFAESLANQSLRKNEQFLELDQTNQSTSIAQSGTKIIEDLEKSLKVDINPSEKLSDVAYFVVQNKLSSLQESLKDQFRFGWLIILFFIIRSFGFLITLIVSAITEGLIQLMVSVNFVHVLGENRTKESVKF